MTAIKIFTKFLPLLLLLFSSFVANTTAANDPGSPDPDPNPNPDFNPEPDDNDESSRFHLSKGKPSPAEELLGDMFKGTIASRYGREHEIDDDEAITLLGSRLEDIRSKQCSSCIDGCRIFTVDGGEQMLELLELTNPQELRDLMGMKPVIVRQTLALFPFPSKDEDIVSSCK